MTGPMIAIVDYQAGNLRSVQKALERSGAVSIITSDASEIEAADGLVFPGQGASGSSMRALHARGLVAPIREAISGGKPFLGVCLGLQLMLEASDEAPEPCLGVLGGRVRLLPAGLKVPHMGWNQVAFHRDLPVFDGIPDGSNFYFVHSYYADPEDEGVRVGTTTYGFDFCSAVAWDNVVAVQFHPEKSGGIGLKLYRNFVDMVAESKEG